MTIRVHVHKPGSRVTEMETTANLASVNLLTDSITNQKLDCLDTLTPAEHQCPPLASLVCNASVIQSKNSSKGLASYLIVNDTIKVFL